MKVRQKALLFFLDFSQLNTALRFELTTFDFSLLTFESFKPSLPLFLTIEEKQWIDLSFYLTAQFEKLNTTQKTWYFQILIYFSFLLLSFYNLSSRPLSSRPLFLGPFENLSIGTSALELELEMELKLELILQTPLFPFP